MKMRDKGKDLYGAIPTMRSKDVLALVQLDPPGIEQCHISNMGKEAEEEAREEEGGDTSGNDREGGTSDDNREGGATKEKSRGHSNG